MRRNKNAFTLVELLVVIGIIAILISILLPALGRVKHQANNVKCAAQMRDLTTIIVMYANENKGMLPPRRGDEGSGAYNFNPGKDGWALNDMGYTLGEKAQQGATPGIMGNGYGLGRLYRTGYLKSLKTVICPVGLDRPQFSETVTRSFSMYVYNPHIAYYTQPGPTYFASYWFKKLATFGKNSSGPMNVRGGLTGTDSVQNIPKFRRAILIDPIYGTADDQNNITHAYQTTRSFNLAYTDGSVSTYTAKNYTARDSDRWTRFLDLSNAIQHANDGGAVNWKASNWTNTIYNAIPILP